MFAKFSVKKPFTVLVAVIIITVFGCVAFTRLTPDLFPKIDLPYAIVVTSYAGATPEKVEKEVTSPLEQQMATLDNIKNVMSRSNENASIVIMEFEQDADMNNISIDIREKIDLIKGTWNDSVGNPVIMKLNPNMIPVKVAAVDMKGSSITEISNFVENKLERKLEGIEGVASVNTAGLVDESVKISLNQDRIDRVNEKIANAINSKFGEAEGKINSGIAQTESQSSSLDSKKKQITDQQEKLAQQTESTRTMLNKNREKLVQLKENGAALKSLYDKLSKAEKDGDQMTVQMCLAQLQQMGMTEDELKAAVAQLDTVDAQIDSIDEALANLNVKSSIASSQLSNAMSEVTSGSALLASTTNQLKNSLSQVQSEKDAAVNSASITGVLTMENIAAILSAQDFEMPAGYIVDDDQKVLVSVGNKITDPDALDDMILVDMGIDGVAPVKVSDVADVIDFDTAADTYAKINGHNGVLLTFSKQSGYSTTEVSDAIADKFESLEKDYEGLEFTVLSDQGEYIHFVVNSVLENLLIGAILAILILLFFLRDIRPTLITAISIPVSLLFAVAAMYFTGVTINVVSLAGLAVGIGMLVDNSIVVIENIYRLRALGYSPVKAAVSGASQVAGAITSSTLTTIVVFVPIVFVEGLTKEIFTDMALTITYSLLASLVIALTLIPACAKGLFGNINDKAVLRHDSRLIRSYMRAVRFAVSHKALFIISACILLVGSGFLCYAKGFTYMPGMNGKETSITVKLPEENSLEDTKKTCDTIVEKMMKVDGVDSVGVMLSSNMMSMFGGSSSSDEDYSNVMIYALLDEDRVDDADEICDEIEEKCSEKDVEMQVTNGVSMTEMMEINGVKMHVYSDDLDDLRQSALAIEKEISNIKGIENVSDSNEDTDAELNIVVSKNKAMKKGLTTAQVYTEVAALLTKEKVATTISHEGKDKDIIVLNETNNDITVKQLKKHKFTYKDMQGNNKTFVLSDIARIENGRTLSTIGHRNENRTLQVSADVNEDYNVTLVSQKVRDTVDNMKLPEGVEVEFSGESEEIMDALEQLMLMMLLGILLVYLIMVAQFQSLISPFIVMFTVPLAFTGGFLALLISGYEISVISMMGFIMLVGIIVNNAIVLIDCINRFRLEGMEKRDAILHAGTVRIRPILMTALTTILGLLPIAVGYGGPGGSMVQPVALVCIGGLAYATLTTLFIIPVMYDIFARKKMEKVKEEDLTVVSD